MKRLSAEDPRWIGDYRLLGMLGEGGMGRVYLARSGRGRTVAVKVVQQELARQPDFRRRFAQEITAARRVGMGSGDGGSDGAEWTAPVLDADTDAATPWVATGYIAGPSLSEVVDEGYGPLPQASVSALAAGLVKALRAIHGAGLVHRDLKPSNILITIDGPRVIDFGIARALDSAMQSAGGFTRTGAMVGSPGFMSPEQVRGLPVTPASDVFCLGTVLAYAATGRLPFGTTDSGLHALMFRIAEEEPDLSGLTGPLYELVAASLAKAPGARPGLDELAARIEADAPSPGGTWLPGEVLAQLGRHAISLLDSEDPEGDEPRLRGAHDSARSGAAQAGPGHSGTGHSAAIASSVSTPPSSPYAPQNSPQHSPQASPQASPQNGVYGPPAWSPGVPQQGGFGAAPSYPGPQGTGTPPPPLGTPPPPLGTPPPVSSTPRRPVRSPRMLGRLMTMTLALSLVFEVARLVLYFVLDDALGKTSDFTENDSFPDVMAGYASFKSSTLVLRGVGIPLIIVMIVLWLIWFWRVRVNAERFAEGRRLRYATELAVAAWFIPVCNFFMPKQLMNDIWAASNPAPAPTSYRYGRPPKVRHKLVNTWWWLWLPYFFISWSSTFDNWYKAGSLENARISVTLVEITDFLGIPAAIAVIFLVNRLNSLQEERIAEART